MITTELFHSKTTDTYERKIISNDNTSFKTPVTSKNLGKGIGRKTE